MACIFVRFQLANKPQRWSLRNVVQNVREKTRLLFQRFYKRRDNTDLVHQGPICKPLNAVENVKGPNFGILERLSKWSRNTYASFVPKRYGHRVFNGPTGATVSFAGFVLATKSSLLTEDQELEGISYEIREAFSKVPFDRVYPVGNNCQPSALLKDLEIGHLLAKGCNAVVYSASWKQNLAKSTIPEVDEHGKQFISAEDDLLSPEMDMKSNLYFDTRFSPFDLAVKLMFNYSAKSDATVIWKAMFKEALPAVHGIPHANMMGSKNRQIPPHPNIVQMYSAFADEIPLLRDALLTYPQALPLRLTKQGFGRNMTLFLIMKRYNCSLKDYLSIHQPSTRTSLLLLCQLLEGLVHLLQHGYVHRDLKTDNVLLDLSHGLPKPVVAITDFGCCLDQLKLPFATEEVDRGGNVALMAPEVVTAEVGPFSIIDYSRSDLWSLGAIAYEIFGAKNPFYEYEGKFLEAATYSEQDLPELPSDVPPLIKKLVKNMLNRNPEKRFSPSLAATICQLLLHAPPDLLTVPNKKNYRRIIQWVLMLSAETYLKAAMKSPKTQELEFQLSYNFCRRIQFSELMLAMQYIAQA